MLDLLVVVVGPLLLAAGLGRWRRSFLAFGAAFVVLLSAAGTSAWQVSKARTAVLGPTVLHGPTDRPRVALTLDDGPTPAYTMDVLDLLDVEGAGATFFVTGSELTSHPALGRAIVERGHELGNHSWSHPRLVFRGPGTIRREVEDTDAAIAATGQQGTPAFRPPYGKRLWDLHRILGPRPVVLWDLEPESDPRLADDPEALARYVVEQARPGSILLLHVMYPSRQSSRDALPSILAGLRQRGFDVVALRDL